MRFLCVRPQIPFLGKLDPKNQNCQLKLKFGTCTSSNIWCCWYWLFFLLIFLFWNGNTLFEQIWFKSSTLFKAKPWYLEKFEYLEFSGDVMFNFSVLDWNYLFWANLVQKTKIVNLSWNLVPRLIRICKIKWWCSLSWISGGNILFGQICSQKNKIVSLSWNWYLVSFRYVEINDDAHVPCFRPGIPTFLIHIFRIQSWRLFFSFRSKIHFWGNLFQKTRINLKFTTLNN